MNYLELCNKVLEDGSLEMTPLTEDTWDSIEAGRRLYPRVKRAVAGAWRDLQMARNEWHFKSKEITATINPRMLIDGVILSPPSMGPAPGVRYKGQESGLELEVVTVLAGPEADEFYLDFKSDGEWNRAMLGEVFEELSPNAGDSSFVYRGRGAYRLKDFDPLMRTPQWATFVAYQGQYTPTPVIYIPWENWLYKELSYTTTTRSAPNFVSQDYKGDITFYPQTLSPFEINFVYTTAPQELEEWDDEPLTDLLPEEYHEWIAWKALASIARFDKNPDLLAYANENIKFYEKRAERNLMPIPQWKASRYNTQRR